MFEKQIVIDAKGHLFGRLASVVAKELLNGQRVVIVRAESTVLSGLLFRRLTEFQDFLGVSNSKNPKRGGPYHYRAPARILWKSIRGMIPHKTARGKAAMERLKIFEGIPHPYSHCKRVSVVSALRTLRLLPGRRYCTLSQISTHFGWSKADLLEKLETKRQDRAQQYFDRKTKIASAIAVETDKLTEVQNLRKQLSALGY